MNSPKFENFYKKWYKKGIFIPILALILSLVVVGIQFAQTGELFKRDVTLKGGISASVYTDSLLEVTELKERLGGDVEVRKLSDFASGKDIGFSVSVSDLSAEELKQKLEEILQEPLTEENLSISETGSKLGEAFFRQLMIAVLFAFIFMGVVIFLIFRTLIPSLAVIFAAFCDIAITLAIVNLLGMSISSAGVVSFLLLIGYSVDTDVLLTTRVLKRRGKPLLERMKGAVKTGSTMTATTIIVLIIASLLTTSLILKQMFLILLIGLIVDIFSTYLTNAGLIYWYALRKGI